MAKDTVYFNANEIEYKVQNHPKFGFYDWNWQGVRLALYDNGVLKQTYEGNTKEFYIRYQAL